MARNDLLSTIQSEIEQRLRALRPLLSEHEQLLAAAEALDSAPRARRSTKATGTKATGRTPKGPKRGRAQRGAAREAILAALEHGSHTVGELVTVTAMSAPNIGGNVRRLLTEGTVSKTERGGRTAYTLSR